MSARLGAAGAAGTAGAGAGSCGWKDKGAETERLSADVVVACEDDDDEDAEAETEAEAVADDACMSTGRSKLCSTARARYMSQRAADRTEP